MCQLNLLCFHDDFDMNTPEVKKDIRNFLYITSIINSEDHPHGHGINFVSAKSKRNFTIVSEKNGITGDVVRKMDTKNLDLTSPIIFHTRKASTRYAKEPVLAENAHPFEGDEFVLAHNGTFTGKHIVANKDDKIIDSMIFHMELEKNWKKKGKEDGVLEVLQKTVNDFSGKMALLFRQKSTNEVFVVRNGRADLHKTPLRYKGKVIGYAINTEKFPIYLINNLGIRFSDFGFDVKSIENIEPMSLFKVGNKDLEKIDDITVYVAPAVATHVNRNNHNRASMPTSTSGVNLKWLVDEFMPVTRFSIPELNLLFTLVGFPLPYIKNPKDFKQAEKKIKEIFNKYYRKTKGEIMDDIYKAGVTLQEFHQNYAFPYFLLDTKELEKIKKEVMHG